MTDYTSQLLTIIELLGSINDYLIYSVHLSFLVVVVTGVILTLVLFYKMLKRFM